MIFLHAPVSDSFPIGVDFYPRWVGTREFWNGRTPYSDAVTLQSQELVFRGYNSPGIKVFAFYYPAYLAFIILPFIFLPIEIAGIIWSAAMWALLTTFYLWWSWRLVPKPKPIVWGIIIVSLVSFRPSIVGILSGQFAPLVLMFLFLCWWLISERFDIWAGVALLMATIKPSLALLPVLVVLLWALRWKRWNVILGFSIGVILIGVITFQRIGWWIPDFINQTLAYAGDSRGAGLAWSPEQIVTPVGFVWLIATLVVSALGIYYLWVRQDFPWIAMFAGLGLNLLITPHAYEYDLMMLLPIVFWLGSRWLGRFPSALIWFFLVTVPLIFSIVATVDGDISRYAVGIWLFYPVLLFAALFFHERRVLMHLNF